jgi:hypothetical protein
VIRVQRCIEHPLAVANADGPQTGGVRRQVSRLLDAWMPWLSAAASDFRPY